MFSLKQAINKPFHLLQNSWEKSVLIGTCAGFSILFINLYTPFDIDDWENDQGIRQFLRLSTFGMIGGLFLALSQFVLRPILKLRKLTMGNFVLWTFGEILLLGFLFFLLFGSKNNDFALEYWTSIKYTFLGLLIPYTLAIGAIMIFKQQEDLKKLSPKTIGANLVGFVDEYGNTKFSLKPSDILFIEAADNYSTIHYLDGELVKKEMIRNSLKSLSEQLQDLPVKRCHRSYMVNVQKVKLAKKTAGKVSLHLEGSPSIIPVSRKFIPDFNSMLS
ncbi:hypothetical protein GCM10028791_33940 [Echinicola sediminis]